MPEPKIEPSVGPVMQPGAAITAPSEPAVTEPQEPRQSEDARRIQAAKDAEIAKIRRDWENERQELEELRRQNDEMRYALGMAQAQSIPDDQQRAAVTARQQQSAVQEQIVKAQQRAALAEVKAEYRDDAPSDAELKELTRTSRNESDFKQRVKAAVDRHRETVREREALANQLREEAEVKVRKELGVDRASTATPAAPAAGGAEEEYRRALEQARAEHKPELAIAAKRRLEASLRSR